MVNKGKNDRVDYAGLIEGYDKMVCDCNLRNTKCYVFVLAYVSILKWG